MAALSDKISWYIDLNASSALRGFKDVADAADKQLGKASKRIGELEKAGSGSKLDGLAARANSGLSKLGVQAELTGASLQGGLAVGAAAAGTALIAFMAKSFAAYQNLARDVKKVRDAYNTSGEDASRLIAITRDVGLTADEAATLLAKVPQKLATQSSVLEKLGIAYARTSNGAVDVSQTLFNVADAFASNNDAAKRAQIGAALFEEEWTKIVPLLSKGGDELRKAYAGVDGKKLLTDDDIKKADQLSRSMRELRSDAEALGNEAAKAAVKPASVLVEAGRGLLILAEAAAKAADKTARAIGGVQEPEVYGGAKQSKEDLKAIALGFDDAADRADYAKGAAKTALTEMAAEAEKTKGKIESIVEAYTKVADSASLLTRAVTDTAQAQANLVETGKAQQTALEARAKAADDYRKAETAASRAREDGPDQIAAAERSYGNALRASAEAADRVTDAQTRLDRARRESSTGLTAAKAELAVIEAQQRLSLAQERASVRRSPLDDQQARVDQLQAQIDLEDALAARANLAAGRDPSIISANRDVADAAAAKADADAAASDAHKSMERTKQDVQNAIDETQSAVDKAYKDFETADNNFLAALIANADAAANAQKTSLQRYVEYQAEANTKRDQELANIKTLTEEGYGALAEKLAAMGPEGYALLDEAMATSRANLALYNAALDESKTKADAVTSAVANALAASPANGVADRYGLDPAGPRPTSDLFPNQAAYDLVYGTGKFSNTPAAAPVTNINVTVAPRTNQSDKDFANELAHTLAFLSSGRGKG